MLLSLLATPPKHLDIFTLSSTFADYRSTSPNTKSIVPIVMLGDVDRQIVDYRLTDDSNSVSKQVTPRDLVKASQVCETRGTDLAPIRPLGAIRDNVDTHLTLWRLNSAVRLTRWDSVALAEEQEVVNERLHVLLHGSPWWWGDLVVLDADRAGGDLVETLVDDAQGLAELLHTAEVAVVAVAVDADGDVELDLVVGVVGLRLTNVPGDAGTAEHDAGEGVVESVGGGNDTDALGTTLPDAVVGQELLGLVNAVAELGGPLVDVVEEAEWQVLGNTTWTDVGGVETGAGDTLVEFLRLSDILTPINCV